MSEEQRNEWDEYAEPAPSPRGGDRAGFRWGLIPILALIIVVAIAAAQNTQDVELHLFTWEGTAPLIVILVITVVISVLFDEIVGFFWRIRRRKRRAERSELQRLRSEKPTDQ